MEFRGRIYKTFPVQSGTNAKGTEWKRQDFVFEYFENPSDRWSDKVLLSIMNERIQEYDLHENDEVVIGFSHNIHDWNGKYFNEMRVYKLEKIRQTEIQPAQEPEKEQVERQPTPPPSAHEVEEKEDDLPF